MTEFFDVENRLPKRGREVVVIVEEKEQKATLFHNEWLFSPESKEILGIKNMKDNWEFSEKVTHWK
jgi:hypothetical protein